MKRILAILKKMSIARRLILYFSLLLAIQMVLIGWFSFGWVSSYFEDSQIKKMLDINSIVAWETNHIRSSGEDLSDRILQNLLFNQEIRDLIQKTYKDAYSYEFITDRDKIESILGDPTGLINTVIVSRNGMVYQSRSGTYRTLAKEQIAATGIYKRSLTSSGNNIWIASNEDVTGQNSSPYLYICRTLKTTTQFIVFGQLIIQIPFDSLESVFKRSKPETGEYYAIIDNEGSFLYNTADSTLIGKKADPGILSVTGGKTDGYRIFNKKGAAYLAVYSIYPGSSWKVVHVLPMKVIASSAAKVRNIVLLIMLLSLAVLLPLLIYLSRNISRPIRKLEKTVGTFGNGNLDIRSEVDRMDEIGHLQASFNTMAADINNLLEKIAEENKHLRLMELNMFKYQINPHFLYNSLDSINWMAQRAGNEEIEEMATALARFFRVGLSKGKEFYKIRDELEHVRQYLLINKIRFKDSFSFEVGGEPGIMDHSTIRIILQPIVENAIKYGVDKNSTTGYITVAAKKDGDSVVLEVSDNGPGISPERLSSIQSVLANHTQLDDGSTNGFGLFNVNQRIWMQFGDGYGISVESAVGYGTHVFIRIPLQPPYQPTSG